METNSTTTDTGALVEFLLRLGQALLACGEQTATVELILRRAATAYGIRRSRVVAFPIAIFISLYNGEAERATLAEGPSQVLRLDQIADVSELGDVAQRGKVPPREGLERLTAILRQPARFGGFGVVQRMLSDRAAGIDGLVMAVSWNWLDTNYPRSRS